LINSNKAFRGVEPNGSGFFIDEMAAVEWMRKEECSSVLKKFLMGDDLTSSVNGKPSRWIIDFNDMQIEEASSYKLSFEHLRTHVKPERSKSKETLIKEKWWLFRRPNPLMRNGIAGLQSYFAVPRVSKWTIFVPCSADWLSGDSVNIVASADFYILGILTSNVHRIWVKAQSSTLEDRTRYTPTSCFETFPFPQTPSAKLIEQIRATAQELHRYRSEQMEKKQWGITKLYNQFFHEPSSQLFKLHAKLDDLVLQAYSFHKTDDLLEKLLTLNLKLAEREQQGEAIIGPWTPE
jgi:hypothetical protein